MSHSIHKGSYGILVIWGLTSQLSQSIRTVEGNEIARICMETIRFRNYTFKKVLVSVNSCFAWKNLKVLFTKYSSDIQMIARRYNALLENAYSAHRILFLRRARHLSLQTCWGGTLWLSVPLLTCSKSHYQVKLQNLLLHPKRPCWEQARKTIVLTPSVEPALYCQVKVEKWLDINDHLLIS